MMMAPIALFVYNRLFHTQETISALQANTLAKESDLFIYSDASKNMHSVDEVQSVREYIKTISGFKSVTIIERKENWGLAKSIVSGVTDLTGKFGKVIVLEDDLITSHYFLQYMNDALDRYEADLRVMHISGYMFPIESDGLPHTYFLRIASCWGWATWSRAWKHFEIAPDALVEKFTPTTIKKFNLDGSYGFWDQVVLNHKKMINTWAIFWYATIFQRNGLCLHPAESLVVNIGNDGSGVHCGATDAFGVKLSGKPITVFEQIVIEDQIALDRTKKFLRSLQPSFSAKLRARIASCLRSFFKAQ